MQTPLPPKSGSATRGVLIERELCESEGDTVDVVARWWELPAVARVVNPAN
ncbi:hypothetical protein [Amycolatopsis sp. FDAARGOS 1241]|uniref:hypothetical protein n=1 Tax=Amycolatopsis sp. FDAARGOS 1241 TaxID=2778070 RepID=UPI00194E173B|nr:hypothetical protein [Amycolatopsis sp. FDAARGOS 1241]QRP42623.1 hypothetical protein I6J71_24260 [Amycolatopsis sp. FDAARGOS 1241]